MKIKAINNYVIVSLMALSSNFSYAQDSTIADRVLYPSYVYAGLYQSFSNAFEKNSLIHQAPKKIYSAQIGIGMLSYNRLDLELAINYKPNTSIIYDASSYNIQFGYKSTSAILNLRYNIPLESKINPYVKLGAGVACNKSNNYIYSESSFSNTYYGRSNYNFAWLAGFGLEFKNSSTISSFIEYNYFDRGIIRTKSDYINNIGITGSYDPKQGKATENNILLGIKYNF
jgi:opacity protein-like surface antigen